MTAATATDRNVYQSRVGAAIRAAWRRFQRTGILPSYWPELALVEERDRAAVRAFLVEQRTRWAWQQTWAAGAPRVTVDGRRIS